MPTGIVRKWLDGSRRVDGQAFGFIQPDDGSADVFAPARTLKGRRDCVSEGLEVSYELKDDDRKGTPMASSWNLPESARSRSRSRGRSSSSGSSRTSRSHSPNSHSPSLQRPAQRPSRSLQRPPPRSSSHRREASSPQDSKPRSPPPIRKSPSPCKMESSGGTFKVTICDIPKAMTMVELEYLAADLGAPVVSSKTYRSGERYHGVVEFYDKADADACILGLEGTNLEGSEFKLRCLHGELEARPTPRNKHVPKPHPRPPRAHTRMTPKRRSRSLPRNRRSPPRAQHNDHFDKQPGVSTYIRPGDWACPKCGTNVFASKNACPYCGIEKNKEKRKKVVKAKKEKEHRSGKEKEHRSRGERLPNSGGGGDIRPGDWECFKCGENVFASKTKCFKCGTPKGDVLGASSRDRGDNSDIGGSSIGRGDNGDSHKEGGRSKDKVIAAKMQDAGDDRSKEKVIAARIKETMAAGLKEMIGRGDAGKGDRVDGSDKQV